MNNASIKPEPEFDRTPHLHEEESKAVRIIEAVQALGETEAWRTLQELVFNRLLITLENDLEDEAKKPDPDTNRLNRLAGQIEWAEKYVDLSKLALRYRNQLQGIRNQLDASI